MSMVELVIFATIRECTTKNVASAVSRHFELDCSYTHTNFYSTTFHRHVPGMLMTCSIDKTVALWDTQNGGSPHPCGSKDMNVGKLHSVSCYPSSPWLLACGGSGNSLAIWDMESEDAIQNRFAGRVNGSAAKADDAETEEPNFEALMAAEASKAATDKANATMNKSKKNKKGGKGTKKNKAHKKK